LLIVNQGSLRHIFLLASSIRTPTILIKGCSDTTFGGFEGLVRVLK
jgi:hypothetical protein